MNSAIAIKAGALGGPIGAIGSQALEVRLNRLNWPLIDLFRQARKICEQDL